MKLKIAVLPGDGIGPESTISHKQKPQLKRVVLIRKFDFKHKIALQ